MDVDGVLSLWGFPAHLQPLGQWASVEGRPHFFSAEAARHLQDLVHHYELAWCTGWDEKADEHLPGLLGVPSGLPHVPLDQHAPGASVAGHWKLAPIDAFAGRERALAWIDDHLDAACHAWAAGRPGPTLLVPTDPAIGLDAAAAATLVAFAAGLAGHSGP